MVCATPPAVQTWERPPQQTNPRKSRHPLTPSGHSVSPLAATFGRRCLLAALAVGTFVLAGCGPGVGTTADTTTVIEATPTEIVVFATGAEYVVGENRFSFGLFSHDNVFIPKATVQVDFYQLDTGEPVLRSSAPAVYRETVAETRHFHDDGEDHLHQEATGVYVVDAAQFDAPGIWGARMEVTMPATGALEHPALALEVRAEPAAVAVGEPAPASQTPTTNYGATLDAVSTMLEPVPAFYEQTVAEALATGRPLVVAFATPAFCVSRMCGPVMDVVAAVHRDYGDRTRFVHVEPYDLESARTTGRLKLTTAANEWRLPTEPWVFVVGADGIVRARFEGLFGADELVAALKPLLN